MRYNLIGDERNLKAIVIVLLAIGPSAKAQEDVKTGADTSMQVNAQQTVVPVTPELDLVGSLLDAHLDQFKADYPKLAAASPYPRTTDISIDKLESLLKAAKTVGTVSPQQFPLVKMWTKLPPSGPFLYGLNDGDITQYMLKLTERTNSVLQNLSPETIASMPPETLNSIAAIILENYGDLFPRAKFDPWTHIDGVAALVEGSTNRILSLHGQRSKAVYEQEAMIGPKTVSITGVPKTIQIRLQAVKLQKSIANPTEIPTHNMIFRHYLQSEFDVSPIVTWQTLLNADTPYVIDRMISNLFHFGRLAVVMLKNVSGVFLTLPGVSPEEVGVPGRTHYVDLRVPELFPVLEIEKDKIYMVPSFSRRHTPYWAPEQSAFNPSVSLRLPIRILSTGVLPC